MSNQDNRPEDAAEIRQKAESLARQRAALTPEDAAALSPKEIKDTLHELLVHEIELEMQNKELRTAQAQIEAERARYFDLYDLAPVGYCTLSEKGLILEANLTAATLLGVRRSTLVKQPISRFILEEDQDIYYLHRKKLPKVGEPQECELRLVKPDGTHFWANMAATTGKSEDGGPVIRLVISDITERKRAVAEREELQADLIQARKLESVGRLAGGVAHDFNNTLGIIFGHAEMILEEMDPDHPFFSDLTEIGKACERSAGLIRQLLAFARKQTVAPRVIDLNETVEGMLKMLRRLIGENIDLVWVPGENVWPVKIDPAQIDQILANLCVNARDAIADVGKLTIETANTVFDEEYCKKYADFLPGEYTLLAVSDDGCGMKSETLENIFEPFFTTKESGKGTGLGLATVYGAVKQNEGFVTVSSEPGQGTTFKIYLPSQQVQGGPLPDKETTQPVYGHETILLAEDEPAILRMTRMMLERTGYKVLAAGTPGEAIALAREYSGEIHLLITDVIMPEMNGQDLAKNLLSLYPDVKRLFMSGYTANVIAHDGVLDEGVLFIHKPFAKKDLLIKVREALE